MKYKIELHGLAFSDDQLGEEPKHLMYKTIELPFAPWVGLAIDLGQCFGVVVQGVIWNCETERFECSITFGWDDESSDVQSQSELEGMGWA
jgi:hypothetical protein